MKKKIMLMALIALFTGLFVSCKNDGKVGDYPILYVVNGADYPVNVYCDNLLVASAGAHNNSGKVELLNTSINLPVYVEAVFYDSKGNQVGSFKWNNYYFRWNKSYKMTLQNSGGTLTQL